MRMNAYGIYGGLQLVLHHSLKIYKKYDVILRIRADMFGSRMQNRKDYKEQFPNVQEWKKMKQKIKQSPNSLHECMRPRAKRIDFCIFGRLSPMITVFFNLFDNFSNVANADCVKHLENIHWPVYSESMIACSIMQKNMSLKYIG